MSKPTQFSTPRADVYARVTDRILADLESGTRPWLRPWASGGNTTPGALPLRHNGIPYRGINVLLLWGDAIDKGFSSSTWLTYKQAQAIGAQVRKGETGSLVVYANRVTKTETNEQGEDTERRHRLHERLYRVQRRADRRSTRAVPQQARHGGRACPAHRGRRKLSLPPPAHISATLGNARTTRPHPT